MDPVSQSITVEDLCLLANSFTDSQQYDKAVQIYESACRIFPENLAIKINLGRVRNMRNQSMDSPKDILSEDRKETQTREMWADRFQGLGEIFFKLGKKEEAEKIFEVSKLSNPHFFLPFFNLGRLYFEMGSLAKAILSFEQANKLNPFHEETVDLLAGALFQNQDYNESLKYAVDGLILSNEVSQTKGGRYRSKIKITMEKIPGFTNDSRNNLIHERRNRIQNLYQELENELKAISPSINLISKPSDIEGSQSSEFTVGPSLEVAPPAPYLNGSAPQPVQEINPGKVYETAALLKKHLIFRNMEDSAVMKVAQFSSEKHYEVTDSIYQEGDPIYGLYLINKGKVELQKSTPFGPIVYAAFEKGSFFGDDNLLYGRERFTSSVAVQETDIIFIDKAGLATIFAREKEIAIHFLWYFWKSLSFQVRESNERMTSFFAGAPKKTKQEILDNHTQPTGGQPTHVEIDKKLEVLQAQGLNNNELDLLAKFSNEEIYNKGEMVFRDGDVGDRLYIVLEGSILISKQISGTGEEALAVLKKGDFFGEMALIGNNHLRSADAKAMDQGTTVLVVTNQALREILSIDTDSAYQLLRILCRILSRRLIEINEKLYQWKMMSGGF